MIIGRENLKYMKRNLLHCRFVNLKPHVDSPATALGPPW
jgi:hypothetical protein